MKHFWLSIILFLFINFISFAQTVTNLRFEQSGKVINVSYDLSGKGDDSFQVKLYCSLDGGKSWGNPLNYVTGDVGENLKPGTNKSIAWDVLKEKDKLVGEVKFKVEATSMSRCRSFTLTHTAGSVAPATKTVTYGVAETNLTGSKKCWITQNLGADRQAISATDNSEASAGWYWQFNRKQGFKHDGTTRSPNTTFIKKIKENSEWLPANDPCTLLLGSGWRLPTGTEWKTADATGGWDNYNETFASVLKLHAAGYLGTRGGALHYRGSNGYYWSSSQTNSDLGRTLYFYGGSSPVYNRNKASGFSARCLRD